MKKHLLLFFITYAILFANTLTFAYNSNKKVSITLLNIENYKTFSLLSYNYGCLDITIHNFENWKKESNSNPSLKEITLDTKLVATPTITSFVPSSGNPGTLVTITGANLGNPTSFTIGGATAIVVSNTGSTLVGMVMPGATTGAISIGTGGGAATSTGSFIVTTSPYPSAQQGNKLVGTGASGSARQGGSVSLSADGKTAIIGGVRDNNYIGAAWIYTRNGSTWNQQGSKLVGSGAIGQAYQGMSVSISADGNTAIVGGGGDNNWSGAVWIYKRNGTTWSQQGNKLVGTGASEGTQQGISVSLSADGNTAIVGGNNDNNGVGAAWIFTRSGTVWSQQGNKLVGSGAIGDAWQGSSVSMSADGNTAMVAGYGDNSSTGAVWIYTRIGTTWSQQGSKLVGTNASGAAEQGCSVSLSADGNTAIVGGNNDNNGTGAAWIFTRNGTSWSQQGNKLVGIDALGAARLGYSVSMSADGNTAIVGGYHDNAVGSATWTYAGAGAAWVYTRNGSNWSQKGSKLVGSGAIGQARQGCSVSIGADGNTAIVGGFNDNNGAGATWVYVVGKSVTYHGNGNTGGSVPAVTTGVNGSSVTLASNTGNLTRNGYIFSGWNTTSDGLGVSYSIGAPYTLSQDITLYAKWSPLPPTITSFTPSSGNPGTLVTINGANLGNPTAFTIGGATAIVVSNTGSTLVGMVMPGSSTGTISIGTGGGITTSSGTFTVTATPYPSLQQGDKLVGTGAIGTARLGFSVSLSADGNTAIVGGYRDNSDTGAAWIYTRNGTTWSQQGDKLVGTGAVGVASQGYSVSMSADGNTAIVGGWTDNNNRGAAWIYSRIGNTWSQQGNKLVGSGALGAARQGRSVALSADGNTAIIGASADNTGRGAVWIFVRNEGTWIQQGSKLVGSGSIFFQYQGSSVSLSADGNTVIVGGYGASNTGAAWIYTRNGTTWSQQGNKLVGTGASGSARQGWSVSMSADGNTAMVGGYSDASTTGAAWIYSRNGTSWSQQGNKLVGTGASGSAQQGYSVALSADGNTAMVGGYSDASNIGAAWVYTRSGTSWSQQGNKLVGTGTSGSAQQGISVSLSADGKTAIMGGDADASNTGAAWVFVVPTTVAYNGNGNTLGTVPAVTTGANGASVALASNTGNLEKTGFTFEGWNTASDGSGTSYAEGDSYSLSEDVTLYSTWIPIPPPTITSFTPTSGNPGTLVTITGNNLGNPTSFTIGGATAIVVSNTGSTLVGMVMPGSSTGAISINTITGTAASSEPFTVTTTPYPSLQQGDKLVGIEASAGTQLGVSVSLSADGNTALIGGHNDDSGIGAAWVYIRINNTWIQQDGKLVGTGAVGATHQGWSVSMSADGNTAIVGGYGDDSNTGAAWIYTRNGTTWSQQGNKLVGNDAVGAAQQGWSVSMSADGNTAIVGGNNDNNGVGAAWVFTRSGTSWIQQGDKLIGTGAIAGAYQGYSVSLSADGNTAIVGGYYDNAGKGATWIYTRNGTSWTQQGDKLVGTGAIGSSFQGYSVALSADGNTAIVGGSFDNAGAGATWIYTRIGSNWSQQGNKLVGSDIIGGARFGGSVSLSADGNTAIVGGNNDNNTAGGASWIFTRIGNSWIQQGSKLVGSGSLGANAKQGRSVSMSADGNTAIVGGNFDNSNAGAAWVFVVGKSVTYHSNGNTLGSVPAVTTGASGTSVSLASNTGNLEKTGFTFEGWNTASDGSGTSYAEGDSYTLSEDVTLYAKWTANYYTLAFDANGGSIMMTNDQMLPFGSIVNLTGGLFTRDGYAFSGWNTASDGTGTSYAVGDSYTISNDVTFYAKWTANEYTITFDANGGNGTMTTLIITYGSMENLSSNVFTREGYAFTGWATTSEGTVTYADGASYTMGDSDITLYAKWVSTLPTTTLHIVSCGATLSATTSNIYAVGVVGASGYEFEVTYNGDVYTAVLSNDYRFRLSEVFGLPLVFGGQYSVRVRIYSNGQSGSYGDPCVVYTPSIPTTTLNTVSCGATLTATTSNIYAAGVVGASVYEFEVTYNGNVYTAVLSNDYRFRLSEVDGLPLLFGGEYSVRVRIYSNGQSGSYGDPCVVYIPSIPTTTLHTVSCGATLTATTSNIYAAGVVGAYGYEFEVTYNGDVYTAVLSNDYRFRLSEVDGLPLVFGGEYSIRVRIHSNAQQGSYGEPCNVYTPSIPTTTLHATSCGATLSATTSNIYAAGVVGAGAYEFEVTYNGTFYTTVISNDSKFRLSEVDGLPLVFGGEYTVRVRIHSNAQLGSYGEPCNVYTPSIPTTTLHATSCGATLSATTSNIYAAGVVGAGAYEFEVTYNGTFYTTVISNDSKFRLSEVDGLPLVFGGEYTVRVRIHSNAQLGSYGDPCNVYTPSIAVTKIFSPLCGTTIAYSEVVYANEITNATAYKFNVYDAAGSTLLASIENAYNYFDFSQMSFTFNTTYQVKVQVKMGTQYGDESSPCDITIGSDPGAIAKQEAVSENTKSSVASIMTAYPNPFTTSFSIRPLDGVKDNLFYQVYDATGKIIESDSVKASEITSQNIGNYYPTGMYLIVAKQGTISQTFKMIKQ
ncbi:InlB B-repeat-containing protein [Flavobacterium sp.]|uniref:InlB B-repeat-containing protein n=1 Tax=Flavobacterium sp. TaxID=239 RepID=UPI003F696848